MDTYSPTKARDNFYKIIKNVNKNHKEAYIVSDNPENNVVIIGADDWGSIQETLYLEQTGVMEVVRERMNDPQGFIDVDDIDWNKL